MTEPQRPKRIAALQQQLADLRRRESTLLSMARVTREVMDDVEAVLELLGAPVPGARLGLNIATAPLEENQYGR